jgi:hypothetical protein
MAHPLKTIPNWVPNVINPKILFITENYPGDPDAINNNTFFYRTLNPQITKYGSNNLLNNLCNAFNIPGDNENIKLNNFLNRNYFLIDTFPHGQRMSTNLINQTINNPAWIDSVLDDITFINPNQIVLTCVGSNGTLLPELSNRAMQRGIAILSNLIGNNLGRNQFVFHSPSNRAFPTFRNQINHAIALGKLLP